MQLADLVESGREPSLPLELVLNDQRLQLQQLFRVLPGQRYVGVASWQGRKVLAKILVGGKSERNFAREHAGSRLLVEQALVTPFLVSHNYMSGQGGWLLFEYLDGAKSLWDDWRAVECEPFLSAGQQALLSDALTLIGRMHACGVLQADLHLDNLLRHQGRLFIIDGGGVMAEVAGRPLSQARALENLAVFFAQLPAELDVHLEELLVHYLLANAEHALQLDMLRKQIAKVRRWRLRDYLKKIGRDCSLFSARIGAFGLRVVRRDREAELQPLLAAPEAFIASGHRFKGGGAATVARVELNGQPLLVKRYNIKNVAHWCKRFWRPSRAWHSWREGHRLSLLGIATPQPLAVLERRWCWLRGPALLITEYLSGHDIIARFQPYLDLSSGLEGPPEAELQALDGLFAALLRERISHGDLKGYNVFWDNGRWSLIDLDAMRQHHSDRSFARAYERDRARFLRNWPADSRLFKLLDQRLPQVPGTCPERG